MKKKAAVIGGGIFGLNIALELDKIPGLHVELLEARDGLMQEASKCNHNRIHLGYHYLRSFRTARQSLSGLLSFMFNYGNSVVYQFPNFYGIAKENSKTDTKGFIRFCERLEIDYEEAWPEDNRMNPDLLEACFKVPEPVFDHQTLKSIILDRLEDSRVDIKLNHFCKDLRKESNGEFSMTVNDRRESYDFVINAAYQNFNLFNLDLGIDNYELLYQDVFIPIFRYPAEKFGLTVMDGPFCSIMPKGFEENHFLLYHVVHSVLEEEYGYYSDVRGDLSKEAKNSIVAESSRFFPFLSEVDVTGFWRTVRVLHRNNDDARLTELYMIDEMENYFAVLSGKVTTCCKVAREIQQSIQKHLS